MEHTEVTASGKKSVLVLIAARGGSKGIPHKNIVELGGHPLIAHTITAVRRSRHKPRLVVTTDDPDIARIAKEYGAEAPYLRPPELASDQASLTSAQVFAHYQLLVEEGYKPYLTVNVMPTYPFVRPETIDKVIQEGMMNRVVRVVVGSRASERLYFVEGSEGLERIRFLTRRRRWYLSSGAVGAWPYFPAFDTRGKSEQQILTLMQRRKKRLRNLGLFPTVTSAVETDWIEAIDIDTPRELNMARLIVASGRRTLPLQ